MPKRKSESEIVTSSHDHLRRFRYDCCDGFELENTMKCFKRVVFATTYNCTRVFCIEFAELATEAEIVEAVENYFSKEASDLYMHLMEKTLEPSGPILAKDRRHIIGDYLLDETFLHFIDFDDVTGQETAYLFTARDEKFESHNAHMFDQHMHKILNNDF